MSKLTQIANTCIKLIKEWLMLPDDEIGHAFEREAMIVEENI